MNGRSGDFMNNTNDKQLNNVQKTKLEEFLQGKRNEVLNAIDRKYREEREVIVAKLKKNKPKNVLELDKKITVNKKKIKQLEKENNKLDEALEKEGYSFCSYDGLSISDISDRKEVVVLENAKDKKTDKVAKLYEETILKVWTGMQSETVNLVNAMVKAMKELI